jgi:hypothetical protein
MKDLHNTADDRPRASRRLGRVRQGFYGGKKGAVAKKGDWLRRPYTNQERLPFRRDGACPPFRNGSCPQGRKKGTGTNGTDESKSLAAAGFASLRGADWKGVNLRPRFARASSWRRWTERGARAQQAHTGSAIQASPPWAWTISVDGDLRVGGEASGTPSHFTSWYAAIPHALRSEVW